MKDTLKMVEFCGDYIELRRHDHLSCADAQFLWWVIAVTDCKEEVIRKSHDKTKEPEEKGLFACKSKSYV